MTTTISASSAPVSIGRNLELMGNAAGTGERKPSAQLASELLNLCVDALDQLYAAASTVNGPTSCIDTVHATLLGIRQLACRADVVSEDFEAIAMLVDVGSLARTNAHNELPRSQVV